MYPGHSEPNTILTLLSTLYGGHLNSASEPLGWINTQSSFTSHQALLLEGETEKFFIFITLCGIDD